MYLPFPTSITAYRLKKLTATVAYLFSLHPAFFLLWGKSRWLWLFCCRPMSWQALGDCSFPGLVARYFPDARGSFVQSRRFPGAQRKLRGPRVNHKDLIPPSSSLDLDGSRTCMACLGTWRPVGIIEGLAPGHPYPADQTLFIMGVCSDWYVSRNLLCWRKITPTPTPRCLPSGGEGFLLMDSGLHCL